MSRSVSDRERSRRWPRLTGSVLLLPAHRTRSATARVAPQVGRADQLRDHGQAQGREEDQASLAVCTADCTVTRRPRIKGRAIKQTFPINGFAAGRSARRPIFKPNGPLLKRDEGSSGRVQAVSTMTATDPTTGATDTIVAHLQAEAIGPEAAYAAPVMLSRIARVGAGGPLRRRAWSGRSPAAPPRRRSRRRASERDRRRPRRACSSGVSPRRC